MNDNRKTKEQLIQELEDLRRRIAELEKSETERKQVDEALRESEEKFRTIFDGASDGMLIADAITKKFLQGNNAICSMLGYTNEEIKSLTIYDIHPSKDISHVVDEFEKLVKGEKVLAEDLPVLRKDGSIFYADISAALTTIEGIHRLVGIFRDITERKQAEEDLYKSEERYRTILEDIDEGYYENDLAGNFTFVNDAECRDLGYSREELIGMNYRQYSDEATAKNLYELFYNIYNTGKPVKRFLEQFISKDGKRHFNEVSASLIRDAKGKPIGFRGVSQDITTRKRAEKQLQDTLDSLRKAVGVTIQVMVSAVEARDPYTSGHQIRSADLARAIAMEMGLPQEKIDGIRMAGSIHDIGKLSIPAEVLSKPTKLSDLEFSLIKEHAKKGYEMLKDVKSPWPLAEIVYQHHERMDGSG